MGGEGTGGLGGGGGVGGTSLELVGLAGGAFGVGEVLTKRSMRLVRIFFKNPVISPVGQGASSCSEGARNLILPIIDQGS